MFPSLLLTMTNKDIPLVFQVHTMDWRWQVKRKRVQDKGEAFTGHHNVGPSRPRGQAIILCADTAGNVAATPTVILLGK